MDGAVASLPAFEVPSLLSLAVRRLKKAVRRSPEERQFVKLFELAASRFGADVIRASDRSDLVARIDIASGDPALIPLSAAISAAIPRNLIAQLTSGEISADFSSMGARYGKGAAKHLVAGAQYTVALAEAVQTLEIPPGGTQPTDPLGFLHDPGVTPEVADALLAGLRATVYGYALAFGVLADRRMDPWLRLAIAEGWASNLREHLRFFASWPGTSVSEDLIPQAERFDANRMNAQAEEMDRRFRLRLAHARASGQPFFPAAPTDP